jgi:aryl-alcohol dehydrogenase-like predicted oxidoreductase
VAIAYQIHHPQLAAPIIGARTTDQLEENLGAAEVELSEEQFERLEDSKPHPLEGI